MSNVELRNNADPNHQAAKAPVPTNYQEDIIMSKEISGNNKDQKQKSVEFPESNDEKRLQSLQAECKRCASVLRIPCPEIKVVSDLHADLPAKISRENRKHILSFQQDILDEDYEYNLQVFLRLIRYIWWELRCPQMPEADKLLDSLAFAIDYCFYIRKKPVFKSTTGDINDPLESWINHYIEQRVLHTCFWGNEKAATREWHDCVLHPGCRYQNFGMNPFGEDPQVFSAAYNSICNSEQEDILFSRFSIAVEKEKRYIKSSIHTYSRVIG